MQPQVIVGVTNVVGQPNGNAAAYEFVNEGLRENPVVYPTPELMQRLHLYEKYSLEDMRTLNRIWSRVRHGQ